MSSSHRTGSRPMEVPPQMPDPALPEADWADAFEIETRKALFDMKAMAERSVGSMPAWSQYLLRLRNLLVAPLGLKPDGRRDAVSEEDMVGIFPILEQSRDRIVLGLNDRHLDFRIVLGREQAGQGQRIRLTTLVRRHNGFGKLYIALVTPFHRAIVAATLRQLEP